MELSRDKIQELENAYVKSLTDREFQAYSIAKNHLGSPFTVHKTNGFLAWIKKQEDCKKI